MLLVPCLLALCLLLPYSIFLTVIHTYILIGLLTLHRRQHIVNIDLDPSSNARNFAGVFSKATFCFHLLREPCIIH